MASPLFLLHSMVLIQWMLMIISTDATIFQPESNSSIKQRTLAIRNTNMSSLESTVNERGQEIVMEEPKGADFNQQRLPEFDSPRVLEAIDSFIGFASSILTIYSFFGAMRQPPKNTVDDVMKLLRTEMKEVKEQINKIEKRLTEQEIYLYQNVEDAVGDAINDYIFQSPVDLPSRAVKLYDRLDSFMTKGMLGQGTLSADLMKTLVDLYDCGSKSILNHMKRFITLVNVGAIGIGYYSTAINNKNIFNGELRIQTLYKLKEAVLVRTIQTLFKCADMSPSTIENYITQILKANHGDIVEPIDVSRLLYERFNEIYSIRIRWLFYTAWNFNPVDPKPGQIGAASVKIAYTGSGPRGVTKHGGWTVYWVGHLPLEEKEFSLMQVNRGAMLAMMHNVAMTYNHGIFEFLPSLRDGNYILGKLESSFFSGRLPVVIFIIINPPATATIGKPLGYFVDIYSQRFNNPWLFREPKKGKQPDENLVFHSNIVDIIIQ